MDKNHKMINTLKRFFGIESVKMEVLQIDNQAPNLIMGLIQLSSLQEAQILSVQLELVEIYTKGTGKGKTVQEFVLGNSTRDEIFTLNAEEKKQIHFQMDYEQVKSKIDLAQEKNKFLFPLIRLAKVLKSVNSVFVLRVKTKVKGSAVPAFLEYELGNGLK